MAEEDAPPRREMDSYLADEMDKACPAGGCPKPRVAAAGTEEEERLPPWPRGPAGGERSEMPWEVSAISGEGEVSAWVGGGEGGGREERGERGFLAFACLAPG